MIQSPTADSRGINAVIAKAVLLQFFDSLCRPRLSNCGLPAATWAEVLTKSGQVDPNILLVSIDAQKFNTAMSKSNVFGKSITHFFDGKNQCGMFRVSLQCQFFYYYAQKMREVAYPMPLSTTWKEKVVEASANVLLVIPSPRARPAAAAVPHCSTDNVNMTSYEPEIEIDSVESDCGAILEVSPSKFCMLARKPGGVLLFRPRGYDKRSSNTTAGETPQDALNCHILLLQSGHSHKDNCRNVAVGRDADIFCTRPPTSIAHDLKFLTSDRELRSFAMVHTNLPKKNESVDV